MIMVRMVVLRVVMMGMISCMIMTRMRVVFMFMSAVIMTAMRVAMMCVTESCQANNVDYQS